MSMDRCCSCGNKVDTDQEGHYIEADCYCDHCYDLLDEDYSIDDNRDYDAMKANNARQL